jgi:deoxyribose-phosphate aldolase
MKSNRLTHKNGGVERRDINRYNPPATGSTQTENRMDYTYLDLAKMIDHSLLNPTLTQDELETGIRLALDYDVASVCIMPYYLKRCAEMLKGSTVKASTTIGFPHGGHTTAIKLAEAEQALADGGEELDMVVNISQVLSGQWDYVADEIRAVTGITHAAGQRIKIIFENCYLNDDQKIMLCKICGEIGVDWVKTSTGYGSGGATDDDLKLMRKHSPAHVQVKAAGGVRDLDRLLAVRSLGVTRCGATRTATMLDAARERLGE